MIEPLNKESSASAPNVVDRRSRPRTSEPHFRSDQLEKTRVAEEVADRIRTLILDGTFPQGQPLPSERVLTEQFGVSRGSIRDAFRMLEMIGLLETRHGRGTFPHELTVDRLVQPLASVMTYQHELQDELLDVRRMFEPAVARAAATRLTEDDLTDLQRILDAQRRKLKGGQSAIMEDTAFHAALARSTRNRVVVSLMSTLNDLLVESRTFFAEAGAPPPVKDPSRDTKRWLMALRRRDAEGAARAMYRANIDQIADLQLHPRGHHGETTK